MNTAPQMVHNSIQLVLYIEKTKCFTEEVSSLYVKPAY